MLYWDVDGVVRDLTGQFMDEPCDYWDKTSSGDTVIGTIDKNLQLLVNAKPTIYYDIAKKVPNISFITSQKESWRTYTTEWINKYFKEHGDIIYVNDPAEKLSYLNKKDYLVEDYPFFSNYSQIILIDRKCNSNVVGCYERIKNSIQLENTLVKLNFLNKNA